METIELNVESDGFVNALERVLPRHGYRTVRSFDLHLDSDTSVPLAHGPSPCRCGCGYTVLLVFAGAPQAGLQGVISVRGNADRSIVSLSALDGEGEFANRFPSILVEAMRIKNSEPNVDMK